MYHKTYQVKYTLKVSDGLIQVVGEDELFKILQVFERTKEILSYQVDSFDGRKQKSDFTSFSCQSFNKWF